MCGIVGFIENNYNLNSIDIEMFESMLLVDSLRGLDSTGAFAIYEKSGSVNWIKQATNPLNLFKTPEWDKFTRKAIQSCGILVGHNRKATQGAINTDNAHPFVVGDTILIHNGGISNFKQFDATKTVDSHAVCSAIDRDGFEKVIPELLGAWVLVWYNMKTKRLYFHRNDQRPLHWVETVHHQIFTSEVEFALFAANRANIQVKKKWEFDTNMLSEYDVMTKKWYSSELKPKAKSTTVTYYPGAYGGYGGWTGDETTYSKPWEDKTVVESEHIPKKSIMVGFDEDDTSITKDQVISIQIDSLRQDTVNGKIKVMGKCISPHLEYCDVVGYVNYTELQTASLMYPSNGVYKAVVTNVGNTVCGKSLWVTDIEDSEYIEDHTKTKWSSNTARFLILEAKGCDKCSKKEIGMDTLPFCVINRLVVNGVNKYSITCPDCVAQTLTGQEKDDFETCYLASLQDGKSVNPKIAEQTH